MQNRPGRVEELDGLRGMAVIMVLAWHFIGSLAFPGTWLTDLAYAATIFGRTGVDLFFVLSGYLIIGIIVDHREAKNFVKVFYLRRSLRIYPPYLVLIALYWICYTIFGESVGFNTDHGVLTQILAQLTFTWNWLMAVTNGGVARGFSVTWSVAIEEWFYLVFPWIVLFTPRRGLVPVLATVGVLSAIARWTVYFAWPDFSLAPYILTPLRLDGLCAGGLLACMVRSSAGLAWLRRHTSVLRCFALVFCATLPFLVALIRDDLSRQMFAWGHLYLALGFALTLAAVLQNLGSSYTSVLRWPMLRQAGLYSYSLYLFHPLFISVFFQAAGLPELVRSPVEGLLALGALASAIALSVGCYWMLERPLQVFGHSTVYGGRRWIDVLGLPRP